MPLGHDLPGEAVAVLQPAALALLAALGQRVPVVVDLVLVGAVDQQRDGLVEREHRTAVDGGERLAVEHELDGQHRSCRARRRPRRSSVIVGDLRVREDRDVELGGFLALVSNQRLGVILGMALLLSSSCDPAVGTDASAVRKSSVFVIPDLPGVRTTSVGSARSRCRRSRSSGPTCPTVRDRIVDDRHARGDRIPVPSSMSATANPISAPDVGASPLTW